MPNCEIYFPISSETNMQIWNYFHSMVLGSVGRGCFKGNVQFLLLCKPPKSCTPQVCITFLQVTQKILTKDIFHWLELITEILSFLQTFSVRKTTSRFFKFPKIYMKIDKISYIHGIFWAFKYKITDYSRGYLHSTVSSWH